MTATGRERRAVDEHPSLLFSIFWLAVFCFVLFFAFPEKMPKTRLEADFLSIHLGAFICFHVLIALCVCLFIKGVTRRGGHKVQVMTKCILA